MLNRSAGLVCRIVTHAQDHIPLGGLECSQSLVLAAGKSTPIGFSLRFIGVDLLPGSAVNDRLIPPSPDEPG